MSKTLEAIRKLPHVLAVDDERSIGNSIIVTLKTPFCFMTEKGCGVRGFDGSVALAKYITTCSTSFHSEDYMS